jgi:hypothetical protein
MQCECCRWRHHCCHRNHCQYQQQSIVGNGPSTLRKRSISSNSLSITSMHLFRGLCRDIHGANEWHFYVQYSRSFQCCLFILSSLDNSFQHPPSGITDTTLSTLVLGTFLHRANIAPKPHPSLETITSCLLWYRHFLHLECGGRGAPSALVLLHPRRRALYPNNKPTTRRPPLHHP